MVISNIVDVHW